MEEARELTLFFRVVHSDRRESTKRRKTNKIIQLFEAKISVLQQGQWALFSSHGTKHLEWNRWEQGKSTRVSPTLNWSKHTAHSSWSKAFFFCPNFAQLNFFNPLFFTPNTSIFKYPSTIDLPSPPFNLSCLLVLNSIISENQKILVFFFFLNS